MFQFYFIFSGSKYRDFISEAILKLQNDQKIDLLRRKWWREKNVTVKCNNAKDDEKDANSLGVEQVGGVFVVLMIGLVISIIVSFIEFIFKAKNNASSDEVRNWLSKISQFLIFISSATSCLYMN